MANNIDDIRKSVNDMRNFLNNKKLNSLNANGRKTKRGFLNEDDKRQISQEELNTEIQSFKAFFSSKGLTAGFEFGSPQPFMIYTDGVLWSGKINDSIAWTYNCYVNQNNRNCTISIADSSPLELNSDSLNMLSGLNSYFEIFAENWISKEYSNSSETPINDTDQIQN